MDIDLILAQNFTVNTDTWLPSCPGSIPLYYYPGASNTGGQDGVLLEIVPNDATPWLGMFAGGSHGHLSGVYGCPNGHSLCVVSSGRCYFARADDPQQWREKRESIEEVRVLPNRSMLLLRDARSLIAYGTHGFLWQTEDLFSQGLTIEAIEGDLLHGKAFTYVFDKPGRTWVEYEVNLVTGKHKGGT